MTRKIIPIHTQSPQTAVSLPQVSAMPRSHGVLADSRGRRLHDLRISVTDRCNFRCTYCMPKGVFGKDYPYLPHNQMLRFEEITQLARVFVSLGVEKLRITGGEPLLRKDLPILIEQLSKLRTPSGATPDLTLTTNASLLTQKAQALKDAGLQRITVSLDSLDQAVFARMNDVDFDVTQVLKGIEAAERVGLGPLKINMVVQRGVNDHTVLGMARHFKGSGHIVRFIEFMDVGSTNGWRLNDVVPSAQLISQIHAHMPLEPIDANYQGEVAQRWRYADGGGEIGVISSVTQAFCASCTRARLSTDGQIFTCLFASAGTDLRSALRAGASEQQLADLIASVWQPRADRYSEIRTQATDYDQPLTANDQPPSAAPRRKVEMSYIGG